MSALNLAPAPLNEFKHCHGVKFNLVKKMSDLNLAPALLNEFNHYHCHDLKLNLGPQNPMTAEEIKTLTMTSILIVGMSVYPIYNLLTSGTTYF